MPTAARLAVGLGLLASGAMKVGDRRWPEQAHAFGTPSVLVPVVPWVELALGALLLAGFGLPWTALAAVALLGMFTVAVAVNLARGRHPPCACFGSLSRRPLGPAVVVRNLILLTLAIVAAL